MSLVLESVLQLPTYSYNYIDSKDSDRRMPGCMAQDVQAFFPELVYQRYDRDHTNPVLTMDYSGLGVIAIKALQEQLLLQDQKIDLLVKRIEKLEQQ